MKKTIRNRNYLGNASNYSNEDVQIARYRSMMALMVRYTNPAPKLRMERFNKKQYFSSWEVDGGTVVEAHCDNIFNPETPIYCGEINRQGTDFVVIKR